MISIGRLKIWKQMPRIVWGFWMSWHLMLLKDFWCLVTNRKLKNWNATHVVMHARIKQVWLCTWRNVTHVYQSSNVYGSNGFALLRRLFFHEPVWFWSEIWRVMVMKTSVRFWFDIWRVVFNSVNFPQKTPGEEHKVKLFSHMYINRYKQQLDIWDLWKQLDIWDIAFFS